MILLRSCGCWLVVATCCGLFAPQQASAAVPELVGVAALATDSEVAKALELDEDQQKAVRELVARREVEGFESAMRFKNSTAEERRTALRPFRIESQRRLQLILNDDQIAKLDEIAKSRPDANYEPLLGEATEGAATVATTPAAPASEATEAAPAADDPAKDAAGQPADEATSDEEGSSRRRRRDRGDRPSMEGRVERPRGEAGDLPGPLTAPADGAPTDDAPTSDVPAGDSSADSAPPADEAPTTSLVPAAAPAAAGDGKLLFNFRYQPWQDVLDWFAEEAGLSLLVEAPPSGTFNYTDNRRYTPAEALDILNSVLLTKGYTLVRRERMLILVNLEDGVPPNLVADVDVKDLDSRGEYELVRVLFKLRNMTPAVASEEIQRMIGPQGSIALLPRAGMIQVTETAGRCRAIRDVIAAVEEPSAGEGSVQQFKLEYITATDVLPVLKQMLGIAADKSSNDLNTLTIAVDTLSGEKILASGTPEMIARVKQVVALVDVAEAAGMGNANGAPQLEVHSTAGADPESILQVLQTLLAETPGLRLTTDPMTGNLVALATPADQATIRATIQQMRADARQVAVIPLVTVDPQLAVLAINKLFAGGGTAEKPDPRAPIIDADLTSNTLFVRATPTQIEEIRKLLSDMGETADAEGSYAMAQKGNVRTIPLSGAAARSALAQVEKLWPVMRPNPIRVLVPSSGIQSYRPGDDGAQPAPQQDNGGLDFGFDMSPEQLFGPPAIQQSAPQQPPAAQTKTQPDRSTQRTDRVSAQLAVMQLDETAAADSSAAAASDATRDELTDLSNSAANGEIRNRPGAPVVIAPGAGGTIIASEDLAALDALEELLSITGGSSLTSTREYAVFYLKYAQAPAAAATLNQMFGGGGGSSGGGGGLMQGIAGAALGDMGGGLMGDLLGLGGGGGSAVTGFSAGSVDIVADARLNLLLVYAQAPDIEMVNQVLEILDQSEGPEEVEAGGKPRLIPVLNTQAEQIAAVVRTIYADRIQGAAGGQPSPEDLLKALRGGGGEGGGEQAEPEKMSIGVDTRSNSIVVRASDPLFEQVKALVEQLDQQQADQSQSTQIVSLKHSNTDAMRAALSGVFGSQAVTSAQPQSSNRGGETRGGGDEAREAAEQARRRMEGLQRFQELMRQGGGGNRGGRGGGGERGGRGR